MLQDNGIPDLKNRIKNISRVLVVVPHADDELVAAGLVLYLKERGAIAHLLTLCDHGEPRQSELKCSAEKIGFDKYENGGFINNKWEDIIENKILFWKENKDKIKDVIQQKINSFQPEALVTYDSSIGATGHPEHLISAEIIEYLFKGNNNLVNFRPRYLFQISLPPKLEDFLVAKTNMYRQTKQIKKVDRMPSPNVAINIEKYWDVKNLAGFCHKSQLNALKRAYLIYDKSYKKLHPKTFSKEYYRLLENK
ncbi:hypothetical protein GBO31_08590 [Aquimarina litoralis]|nr:hypothetical protein [Aquimarina litoralis]